MDLLSNNDADIIMDTLSLLSDLLFHAKDYDELIHKMEIDKIVLEMFLKVNMVIKEKISFAIIQK